jgi:hypothetical protein
MARHALLTSEEHFDLRIRTERGPDYGDAVMTALALPDEFRRLQDEYPILFRMNQERSGFTAVALFGFTTGENLFVRDGTWDANYRPLSIEIQPFLIGGAPDAGDKQVHVDLDSPRVGGTEGVRLFDEHRRPTPYLEAMAERLGELDTAYTRSGDFFAALVRYDLLEPLTLEVTLDDGSTNRLVGFHVIDEDRLETLDAAALGELYSGGHLMPIFMAVASLGRLSHLIERKNRDLPTYG